MADFFTNLVTLILFFMLQSTIATVGYIQLHIILCIIIIQLGTGGCLQKAQLVPTM